MSARSGYVSANEFGRLSVAFDTMADNVEAQMRLNEQALQLNGVMSQETELRAFCCELLKALIEHTGSQIGAVYLLNQQQTAFEHFESVGLGVGGRASFSAAGQEGEFGMALTTGKMQRVTDIPEDTQFTFVSVCGVFRPREIITLPLLLEQAPVAMLSLASVRCYDKNAVRLLEVVHDTLAARMGGALLLRQSDELAKKLDHQNTELVAQKQELSAQADELNHQNTELESQKNQLQEVNRLKSAFLSNMSHELRTPLNSVIALSGVLSRRLTGTIPDEEYGYLEVIERNGKQLLAMINNILDLSRIEAGREEFNLGKFSIRSLVGDIVDMLEPLAKEKNIALVNRVGDGLPSVTSDPDKCRHILQNLVANALKFTEAGSVEISALQKDGELHVAVHDTGIGIAAEHLPHIFDEFRQADGSTSRRYGGTGLGLAIARKYALLLRGNIIVESTPGKGSTFTLILPLTISLPDAGTVAVPAPRAEIGVAATAQGQDILLVEDTEPAVIQMTDILVSQGYHVRVARNGREALAQIATSLPAALILDLMMPEMDGFQLLRELRGTERTVGLPVLILTAKHVSREELSVLKGNNIHQLIEKGDIDKRGLLDAIAKMVAPGAEKPVPPSRLRTSRVRSDKPVILLVEDNPDNLRTARALLQDVYTVIEAADGRNAVEQARQHCPDLILTDLALPIMDGFAVLEAIREDKALRAIPVVALTASAMKGDREQILARGFDGYLSKPIEVDLFHKTLREVLHGQS